MGIKRLNHAVLYVSDVAQSSAFYKDTLGFKFKPSDSPDKAVFSQAAESDNDHDLALFSKNLGQQRAGVFRSRYEAADPSEPPAGLYHLAWEVDKLSELSRIRDLLQAQGRLGLEEDHGVHKSIYGHDPDGLLFEVAWFVPPHLLTDEDKSQTSGTLDLEKELQRFAEIA
ncbi:VOC family protein [Iodobacter sp. LRB]|uniref:VOC family protein n=1 Tax=unclassified Iodobacter TaxID=235634 RepID=UPI000C0F2D02|nr:VOC family protein [Iodobacter sp. BJB302]PHV02524.1 glyoxalase [Iodobacter sp. BJB302]